MLLEVAAPSNKAQCLDMTIFIYIYIIRYIIHTCRHMSVSVHVSFSMHDTLDYVTACNQTIYEKNRPSLSPTALAVVTATVAPATMAPATASATRWKGQPPGASRRKSRTEVLRSSKLPRTGSTPRSFVTEIAHKNPSPREYVIFSYVVVT